jgi:hypothetical protein
VTERQGPGALRSVALLALFDLILRAGGMRRAIAVAHRLGRPRRGPAGEPAVIARTVAAAASLYPRRALCLEQSLVLLVLLRRRGHAAELRFGVRPYPFHAHAWIEIEGAPVNERADAVGQLAHFEAAGGR